MFAFKPKPIKSDLFGLSLTSHEKLTESILLASSIGMPEDQVVLELGMGTGITALCLTSRLSGVSVVGLESQWENLKIVTENIENNHMRGRIQVFQCDFISPPPRLAAGTFSQVVAHGLFLEEIAFEIWMKFALLMTKHLGVLTCIIGIENLGNAMRLCHEKLGNIKIFPIWPYKGAEAHFVIIQGLRGAPPSLQLLSGLTLCNEGHMPLSEAESILHHGQSLIL